VTPQTSWFQVGRFDSMDTVADAATAAEAAAGRTMTSMTFEVTGVGEAK